MQSLPFLIPAAGAGRVVVVVVVVAPAERLLLWCAPFYCSLSSNIHNTKIKGRKGRRRNRVVTTLICFT
jgi:hypothetical protein